MPRPAMLDDTGGKICTKCGVWKPLDDFHKQKAGKFGRHPVCKVCTAEYNQRPEVKRAKAKYDREYDRRLEAKRAKAERSRRPEVKQANLTNASGPIRQTAKPSRE